MQHFTITGVIIAGGRARRMEGMDKALIELAGKPLLEHVIAIVAPQVGQLLLNVNRNLARYASYGLPLVQDASGDYPGPLAGILSALRASKTDYLLCVPCDTPLLPVDLAARLLATLTVQNARLCVAHDGQRMQPLCALLSCQLADNLERYLAQGEREVESWITQQQAAIADFSDQASAFINVNTPPQLMQLETQLLGKEIC